MEDNNFYVNQYIDELRMDLSQKKFILEISEEGVKQLENKYTQDIEKGVVDLNYFRKYFHHIIVFLGESYFKENKQSSNQWIFEKSPIDNKFYPTGIKCRNGLVITDFIPVLNDVLIDDLQYIKWVSLMASYSRIHCDCQ